MAISRYDQRKNLEAAEANAIGTAYVRADLLPAEDAGKIRDLLRAYLDQRVRFYLGQDERDQEIQAATAKVQAQLWEAVVHAAMLDSKFTVNLAVAAVNDVLNSEGYTSASWRNRIPPAAWALMGLIAISCNLLIGYGERRTSALITMIMPLIISIALFLIADIDSPRGGVIDVLPNNLTSLAQAIGLQPPR